MVRDKVKAHSSNHLHLESELSRSWAAVAHLCPVPGGYLVNMDGGKCFRACGSPHPDNSCSIPGCLEQYSWASMGPTSSTAPTTTTLLSYSPQSCLNTPLSLPLWSLKPAIFPSPCGRSWSLKLFFSTYILEQP